MKYRLGFVSNSSSSSFIVNKDLTDIGISCLKLTEAQINRLRGYESLDGVINIRDDVKNLWLTQYISDCSQVYDEIDKVEHLMYDEGCLNEEPREERLFNEYQTEGNSVYLLKCHDDSEQMSINQFIKRYKKDNLPQDVIVTFESDGVCLKYVW